MEQYCIQVTDPNGTIVLSAPLKDNDLPRSIVCKTFEEVISKNDIPRSHAYKQTAERIRTFGLNMTGNTVRNIVNGYQ